MAEIDSGDEGNSFHSKKLKKPIDQCLNMEPIKSDVIVKKSTLNDIRSKLMAHIGEPAPSKNLRSSKKPDQAKSIDKKKIEDSFLNLSDNLRNFQIKVNILYESVMMWKC